MRRGPILTTLIALLALLGAPALGKPEPEGEQTRPATPAFRTVDVWLTTSDAALVAYQVELRYDRSRLKIAGLEGGDAAPFHEPPHYDPAGLTGGRLVLAALTADDAAAPRGRIRVARLHLFVENGEDTPSLETELVTAARPGGERIAPKVELTEGR